MKYGNQSRLKYLLPFRKGLCLGQKLSDKPKMRLRWIDYIEEGNSVLKTSRHFDIPEPTVRYWYHRYNKYNLKSLINTSRRPHKTRTTIQPMEVIQRVIDLRRKYPSWGKLKIQYLLKLEGINVGQSRIQKIINSNGLKRMKGIRVRRMRRNRKHMYTVPPRVKKQVGGLVYLDVKHLQLPEKRVYQFTAVDHHSRYLYCKIYEKIRASSTVEFLNSLPFRKIKYIGTDNGSEFLGVFDQELKKRRIKHVFSSPHSPKQNPFVERVIKTIIQDFYEIEGTSYDMEKQQERLDMYVKEYNEVRPHQALGLKPPVKMLNILSLTNS